MNMKKTIGICATLFAALLCAVPQSAQASGKIRSVDAFTDEDPENLYTFPNAGRALTVGDTVYIRFRLVNLLWGATSSDPTYTNPWSLNYTGSLPDAADPDLARKLAELAADKPRLGLWISGRLREAELISGGGTLGTASHWLENIGGMNGERHYTDVIFAYKVQAGDIALPLQFANASGTGPSTGAEGYYLKSHGQEVRWEIQATNETGIVTADFQFGKDDLNDDPDFAGQNLSTWEDPASGYEKMDVDLSQTGVYIQATDLDKTYDNEETGIWRTIAKGSTTANPGRPTIEIAGLGGAATRMTLYVWTANTNIAEIVKSEFVTEVNDYVFSDGVTRKVGTVEIGAERTSVPFDVKATGDVDATTQVFLGTTPTNIFNVSGNLVSNFVTRTVKVGEPLPPNISVTVNGKANDTVTADADESTALVNVNVTLSEAYPGGEFTIPLKLSVKDKPELNAQDYVGMSQSSVDDNTAWDTVLTIPSGQTSASLSLWMYANRGTVDTQAGLVVEVDTNALDSAARTFFTGKHKGATVFINPSTPTVTTEFPGEYPAESGQPLPITVAVTDAFGERDGPYTIEWAYDNPPLTTNEYSAIVGTVTRMPIGQGHGATVDFSVPIKDNKKPGVYTNYFHVVNQDGVKSSPDIVFVWNVKAPLSKGLSCAPVKEKFAEDSHNDQDVVTISFADGFSMPDKYSQPEGYLFLIPQTLASSNLVECGQLDWDNASDWKRGKQLTEQTPNSFVIPMKLRDGKETTRAGDKLRYKVVIRTAENIDEGELVTEWGSGQEFSFWVTNVAPKAVSVTMSSATATGGAQQVTENGGQMPVHVSLNVEKRFSASVGLNGEGEPSEVDLYADDENDYADPDVAFATRWSFKLKGTDLEETEPDVYGPPSQKVSHRFTEPGEYEVTVLMRDKDMYARNFEDAWLQAAANKFTFTVIVDEKAAIDLSPKAGTTAYGENDSSDSTTINVSLTQRPTSKVTVQLSVERKEPLADDETEADYPLPVLDKYTIDFGGDSPNKTNATFYIKKMDGTERTYDPGFTIRAAVTSTTLSPDGMAWTNVYRMGELDITIANKQPMFADYMVPDTNAVERAINTPFDISYSFTDNIFDMAAGETLYWTITGESPTNYVFKRNVTTSGNQTFTTMFTSSGAKTVQLQIQDKDGAQSPIFRWYFIVKPSKQLVIYPRQPDQASRGKAGVSSVSMQWIRQVGLGDGRVWADGAMKQFSDFKHIYTYSPSVGTAYAYAHGYKVGDEDNGSLTPGKDFAVTMAGEYPATSDFYVSQEASGLDSFFYAWLLTASDGGKTGETKMLTLAPAYGENSMSEQAVTLPAEEADALSYPDTILEAIFAKEYLTSDNLGDLNQDGIPDIYAVSTSWGDDKLSGTLLEISGHPTTDDGSDATVKFNAYNTDGDYLPSRSYVGGIPSTVTGWVTHGQPFSAWWEIRGFHEGLNHRTASDGLNKYVRGTWVSEPCFSEAETNAVAHWNGLQTFAAFKAVHAGDDDEAYAAALADWQAAFDAKIHEHTSWIPEKRTDPTLWDTDDDGFPDGYEYYFWYQAAVGRIDEEGKWQQMKGSRFTLKDIAQGIEISPAEIMAAFDPTVKATGDIPTRDTDNDGLTDLEELAMGTNPVHWDSDRDGMSDLWEVMRGMNPLKVPETRERNVDGDAMASFTTAKEEPYAIAKFTNADGETVFYAVPNNGGNTFDAVMNADQDEGQDDGQGVDPDADPDDNQEAEEGGLSNITAIAVYRYGGSDSAYTPISRGAYGKDESIRYLSHPGRKQTYGNGATWGDIRIATAKPLDPEDVDVSELTFVSLEKNKRLLLVHDQVYAQFGFDPRTAWNIDKFGYVSSRWDPSRSTLARAMNDTGKATNTVAYSCVDEYLVLKYRYMTKAADTGKALRSLEDDLADVASKKKSLADVFAAGTTNPNVPFEKVDYAITSGSANGEGSSGSGEGSSGSGEESSGTQQGGASIPTYTSKNHGADTDGDGVPDGWELYVGYDPNNNLDAVGDADGDGLSLVAEYAGTDSCNAYSNAVSNITRSNSDSGSDDEEKVATIYDNHPGLKKGWFNKFFPTDPWDIDTDGDGLSDRDEGSTWSGTFQLGRSTDQEPVEHTYTFIYGDPSDNTTNSSWCIRGGGLNPCSVDTDGDLLPDPWEHDFAGVVFKAGVPWKPGDSAYGTSITLASSVLETINRNDAMNTASGTVSVVECYITAGMDGTFGPNTSNGSVIGDAVTSYAQIDPRTGTKRNFDFDNDGLQNFQEYLVQALRHFRFDDSETPLMGSYLPNGLGGSRTYVGFLPMQVWDGTAFFTTAREAGFTGLSAYGGEGFRYGDLGYFIRPPKAWDPVAQNNDGLNSCANYDEPGYRVMLRPAGLSSRASADGEDRMPARSYASTDPRRWDSDNDGMDDYYELFHGLNPLLGNRDVIGDAYAKPYGKPFGWRYNAWLGWPKTPMLEPVYDVMQYPWFMGMREADPDGDGLRNEAEALLVNTASPPNYHTDPTPLWMTDSSTKTSFTGQYYGRDWYMTVEQRTPDMSSYFWFGYVQCDEGHTKDYMFSFEENEGYDTDHDWLPDGHELTTTVQTSTDPLNGVDPDRRQALYLTGENSALISYSGELNREYGENYAMLRQFTVETWIRPEAAAGARTIITRVSDYPASTLSNAEHQVRANFRIALDEQNRVYGQYDSNDAVPSGSDFGTTTVLGVPVEMDVWTHVALTFDGYSLVLYMNGREVGRATADLIPANGIILTSQSVTPTGADFGNGGYSKRPTVLLVGADAAAVEATVLNDKSSWGNYGSFYKGWVDEVRVWDGARTAAQIVADYKKRYSLADISDLRDQVFAAWKGGATHNNNDGRLNLPAELLLHYNFQQLPSEVTANYVASEPSGFTEKVVDNVKWNGHSVDLRCGWWSVIPLASTVYGNRTLVPWIRNTCGVLPALDGSTPDSRFYSELIGGVTFPVEDGVASFSFPNAACPYPYWKYMGESYFREWMLWQLPKIVGGMSSLATDVYDRFKFDKRTYFVQGADLLPLGDAYAKRCVDFWDGHGSTDAWTATADDLDADDLPDWWEALYAGVNGNPDDITPMTVITYDGLSMTAREAYLRDLAKGLLPGGSLADLPTEYRARTDRNLNDIPDWWELLYGLNSVGVWADKDDDQLSDYNEWLIGEGFAIASATFPHVSPVNAWSFQSEGQIVPDYFLPVGKLYLGGMFADHDFMEDAWEVNFPGSVVMGTYDPHLDPDEDGWSNFAECRAGTSPALSAYLGVDAMAVPDYPVPTVKVVAKYHGTKPTSGTTTYVQAWRADDMSGQPDAVWQMLSLGDVSSDAQTGTSSGNSSATKKNMTHAKLIGMNPNREITLTLGPGSVIPGSVLFSFKDISWKRVDAYQNYDGIERVMSSSVGEADSAVWLKGAVDRVRVGDANWGDIVMMSSNMVAGAVSEANVGEINYQTGAVVIDLSKVQGELLYDRQSYLAGARVTNWETMDLEYAYYIYYNLVDLSASQVKVDWQSKFAAQGFPQTYYLADSATAEDGVVSRGRLREGKNIFAAFIDLDNNGAWSPGEPYGAVANVDVGWSGTSCEIEMMDTTPQMVRIDLAAAIPSANFAAANKTTDRGQVNLNSGTFDNRAAIYPGTNMPDNVSSLTKVRVVRNWINGEAANGSKSYSAVVLERDLDLSVHPALTEADLLGDGVYDLDWGTLLPAYGGGAATLESATYRIVIGNDDVGEFERGGNNLPVLFSNRFETRARQTPTVPDPALAGIVYAGQPTFRWSHTNSIDKLYPAFQLKIYKADQSTVVYDSGVQQAPARSLRDVNGQYVKMYEWTAPVYAGMVTPKGFVFDTTNNYYWAVSMLDAKFTEFNDRDGDEVKTQFRLSTTGNIEDGRSYGSIKVAVKYFGPLVGSISTSASSLANLIHVQAFTTPDFTGMPVGEAYVTNVAEIASISNVTVNAIIRGVPAGTYYIRAFVDTNANFQKDLWETWGYGCYVGDAGAPFITIARGNLKNAKVTAANFPYTIRGYKVGVNDEVPVATIYMEDADTDFDGFPDAWEVQTYGSLGTRAPITGNTFFATVNPNLLASLSAYSLSREVASSTANLGFTLMGALMSGSGPSAVMAASLLSDSPDAAEETTSVAIKSFSLEDGLDLEVVNESKSDTANVITFKDEATVTLALVCATTPDFSDAVEVPVKTITIRSNDTVVEAVSAEELAAARAQAPDARFFKAVIK